MDWDDLRYVLAVARERTLSGAAEKLRVTHTTVGRRLEEIERSLGVRLFDRTPDGFMPTPAGQDISDVAERLESEVLSLEGRVLGRDAELKGSLRVATMDILFRRHHRVFSTFGKRYPSIALTVLTDDEEVSLTRRQADVALRMTNTPPEYLVGRKVGRVDFAVYASKKLVAQIAKRHGKNPPLDAYPWLHWDERLNMRWLDDWLARKAPKAEISMRLDVSSLGRREAVAAGLGVHHLACFEGDDDPRLERIGPVEREYSRDLWLLTLKDLRSTQRIRAFMDHVEESLCG